MEKHLKTLIQNIKTGSRAEVKEAQKQVEKFWHDFYIPHREEGRKAFTVFLAEIKKIGEIEDLERQAYLISTLKWPLWAIGEEYFEFWEEFVLKYIQHPSGKIRQAVVRAAKYLVTDLTLDTRLRDQEKEMTTVEDIEKVDDNIIRFGRLVLKVRGLIGKYYQPKYHRRKYISDLPAGVYKSLQKLLAESLFPGKYYEKIYAEFEELLQERFSEAFRAKSSNQTQ